MVQGPRRVPGVGFSPVATVAVPATLHPLSRGDPEDGQAEAGRAGLAWGKGEERHLLSLLTSSWGAVLCTQLWPQITHQKLCVGSAPPPWGQVILTRIDCLFMALSIQPGQSFLGSSEGWARGPGAVRLLSGQQQASTPGVLVR